MAQWLSWLERRPVTAEVEGSSPFWVVSVKAEAKVHGIIAQLGEHLPYKQGVTGSSPVSPTIYILCGLVVQLVRMPACHAGGRGFESLPGRQLNIHYAGVAQR